jgi:hypothetical protein
MYQTNPTQTSQNPKGRDAAIQIGATDRGELLALAKQSIEKEHAAILAGDEATAIEAWQMYDEICYRLNGNTNFASQCKPDGGTYVAEQHCRATPGDVPMWGQVGEFLIEADGVRSIVEFCAGYGGMDVFHMEFHAVDLCKPFISHTGYQSHFFSICYGLTVDVVAKEIFHEFLIRKNGRVVIAPEYRQRFDDGMEKLMRSLNVGEEKEIGCYEEANGQISFAF